MEIKLKSIAFDNFKGLRDFKAEFNGSATILGDNGTGKTTVMDGFLWVLFGKDSQDKADFAVKTLDAAGQEIHNLDHSVELTLDVNGQDVTLGKTYKEKWTKRRGQATREFTGHTTDYSFDGVPTKEKDFKARVAEIVDEASFKLLTSPWYFNNLHWQKRREILIQVCGDVDDAAVIDADPDTLGDLPGILENRSLDDHRAMVRGQMKKINDKLKEIPARIDEAQKIVAPAESLDKTGLELQAKHLAYEIEKAKDDRELAALRKEKAELQAQMQEAKTEAQKISSEYEAREAEKINEVRNEMKAAELELKATEDKLAYNAAETLRIREIMNSLRENYHRAATSEYEGDTVCPTCGQDLPEDQVEAAVAAHNVAKAAELTSINEKGKAHKADVEKFKQEHEKLKAAKESLLKQISGLEVEVNGSKNDISNKAFALASPKLEEASQIQETIDGIQRRIDDYEGPDTSSLESELTVIQGKLALVETSAGIKKRIKDSEREEKRLAAEYEEMERQLYLTDQFIRQKVDLLEDQINSKFELARFKLFNVLVNGGIEECCTTLYEGVPYGSGLNTGAEINVGLDICRTLSNHYGIKAPIFIDHAESVTEILDIGSQAIKLAVDRRHKDLVMNAR
jgi:DNA repair exonuclease SbcCD ATPase subunit